ncbi:MAG TPA: methyltransferase domain-containing protein [Thermoanaerobaculia bacterium]|jgi:SAM-dependent methyltransferase|nr:methyltransferase domain-containing protein [Thermoanaerobaculia bacterium]
MNNLREWLAHPLTRGLDIDDPRTTLRRRQILQEKPFLRRIYKEWYQVVTAPLPPGPGAVLELGAGAGFLADFVPGFVHSEIFFTPWVDVVMDGLALPLATGCLRGIVMINVLHHLPRPVQFFTEAARCVHPGGVVTMIEPWVTPWSRLVYTRFHHEPFLPGAQSWDLAAGGPLSAANGALPWILFQRDRERFKQAAPEWQVRLVRPMMPFRYLVSGGISLKQLVPAGSFPLWRALERALAPFREKIAMFAHIVLERESR